jgi:hypothetical protein
VVANRHYPRKDSFQAEAQKGLRAPMLEGEMSHYTSTQNQTVHMAARVSCSAKALAHQTVRRVPQVVPKSSLHPRVTATHGSKGRKSYLHAVTVTSHESVGCSVYTKVTAQQWTVTRPWKNSLLAGPGFPKLSKENSLEPLASGCGAVEATPPVSV